MNAETMEDERGKGGARSQELGNPDSAVDGSDLRGRDGRHETLGVLRSKPECIRKQRRYKYVIDRSRILGNSNRAKDKGTQERKRNEHMELGRSRNVGVLMRGGKAETV
jgi:hypothetical protein